MHVNVEHYTNQWGEQKSIVTVDDVSFYFGNSFVVGDFVGEVGTTRKWSPAHSYGFKLYGREVAEITECYDFGFTAYYARQNADAWCEKARKAYEVFTA